MADSESTAGVSDAAQGQDARRLTAGIAVLTWKMYSTGVMFRMMEGMMEKRSVFLTPVEIHQLRQMVPPLRMDVDLLPAMLVAVQTLASVPGVRNVLRSWGSRENLVMLDGRQNQVGGQAAQPIGRDACTCDFGLWSLAVQIILRFLNQAIPLSEPAFLVEIGDIYRDAGVNSWAVDVMVHALYFIKRASWVWGLFPDGCSYV